MLEQLVSCPKQSQTIYRRHRPEKTVLFEVIKKHYRTWRNTTENPIPKYIERTFEKYLDCGNLAKGFACAHCDCCNADFFIGFSCKKRGICPSCNTLNMVKTAAHLVENIIPLIPIRQWVISFPLRIRHYLLQPDLLQPVLDIVVQEIRKKLIVCRPNVLNAEIGCVSFIQNFGSTLNVHPHFHLIVSDGIFYTDDDRLEFHEASLTLDDIIEVEDCIQKQVLRFLRKKGFFSEDEVEKMLSYDNSGFSLDASVRIQSWDRSALERVIRYCARPCFSAENLRWNGPWLIYRLSKPTHKGQTFIQLTPLEFLDKITALIPLPNRHRRHYYGVFAPNSPLRKLVVAHAKQRIGEVISPSIKKSIIKIKCISLDWAELIKRIYEVNPLICSKCGQEIKIVRFVTQQAEINRILRGMGWKVVLQEFDPPYEIPDQEICQLTMNTEDGFPPIEQQVLSELGIDPPMPESYYDPPHEDEIIDPPHWDD